MTEKRRHEGTGLPAPQSSQFRQKHVTWVQRYGREERVGVLVIVCESVSGRYLAAMTAVTAVWNCLLSPADAEGNTTISVRDPPATLPTLSSQKC